VEKLKKKIKQMDNELTQNRVTLQAAEAEQQRLEGLLAVQPLEDQ
jgi:hypothetical protein